MRRFGKPIHREKKTPPTPLELLRDIRASLFVIMLCCAAIAGNTCGVVETAEFVMEIVEEQDEAEADQAMVGGAWI